MRIGLAAAVMLGILAVLAPSARAQVGAAWLQAAASTAKDLELPKEPSRISAFSSPGMAIYKPEGAGPFPAVVLAHQCGGLGMVGKWQNVAMVQWAKEAVSRGYVAFVVDFFGQRGVDTVCYGVKGGVNPVRAVKDALQAAEHLRRFDFVDKGRIALAGYSWGAMVALGASSKLWSNTLAPGGGFAAIVAFYPGCFTLRPPSGPYELVQDDIDRPLLVLMGDKDTETPAAECVPKLEKAKAAGGPVQWHVYPGVTHCWDCENLHGFRKTDFRNTQVVYYYDRDATRDAAERMFAFFGKAMPAR